MYNHSVLEGLFENGIEPNIKLRTGGLLYQMLIDHCIALKSQIDKEKTCVKMSDSKPVSIRDKLHKKSNVETLTKECFMKKLINRVVELYTVLVT